MQKDELFKIRNKWREMSKKYLDIEGREGLENLPVEFIENVEVFDYEVNVPISLDEIAEVGKKAKFINNMKMKDAIKTAKELKEELKGDVNIDERGVNELAISIYNKKAVHERDYVKIYAFWKAVEMLYRRK